MCGIITRSYKISYVNMGMVNALNYMIRLGVQRMNNDLGQVKKANIRRGRGKIRAFRRISVTSFSGGDNFLETGFSG